MSAFLGIFYFFLFGVLFYFVTFLFNDCAHFHWYQAHACTNTRSKSEMLFVTTVPTLQHYHTYEILQPIYSGDTVYNLMVIMTCLPLTPVRGKGPVFRICVSTFISLPKENILLCIVGLNAGL